MQVTGRAILAAAMVDPAPASAGVAVPGSAWRRGMRMRTRLPEFTGVRFITCAAWSPDSTRIAFRCDFGPGGIADAASGRVVAELPVPASIDDARAILYAPDGRTILMGGLLLHEPKDLPVALRVLDAQTGQVLRAIPAPMLADNGTRMAPWGNSAQVVLYDPVRGEALVEPAFSPLPQANQGPLYNGLLRYRFAPAGALEVLPPVRFPAFVADPCSLQAGGPHVAFIGGGGSFRVFDRASGALVTRVDAYGFRNHLIDLAYSPDGGLLLAAMSGTRPAGGVPPEEAAVRHKVAGFRAPDYARAGAIDAELPWIKRVAFHPDGSVFAVGFLNGIALFDRATFAPLATLEVANSEWEVLAFSPDGSAMLAVGTGQNVVAAPGR